MQFYTHLYLLICPKAPSSAWPLQGADTDCCYDPHLDKGLRQVTFFDEFLFGLLGKRQKNVWHSSVILFWLKNKKLWMTVADQHMLVIKVIDSGLDL